MRDHISRTCQDHLNYEQCRSYNRNENSSGSVIPVNIHASAAERRSPPAAFFFSGFAQRYIASAAPGRPKIIKINSPEKYLVASALKMCYICRISKLCKEDILSALYHLSCNFHSSAHCCLPEWHIKYMMQPKGDQCSFNNTKNQEFPDIHFLLPDRPEHKYRSELPAIQNTSGFPQTYIRLWK